MSKNMFLNKNRNMCVLMVYIYINFKFSFSLRTKWRQIFGFIHHSKVTTTLNN
jgi:hypothetical protein